MSVQTSKFKKPNECQTSLLPISLAELIHRINQHNPLPADLMRLAFKVNGGILWIYLGDVNVNFSFAVRSDAKQSVKS